MLYVGDDKYRVYVGNQRAKVLTPVEYILFEINNVQFNGTASSVIDTGIKLWDGTYDNWVLECEFTTPNTAQYETLFVCRPDYSPHNGIRIRRSKTGYLQATFGNTGSVTKISGNLNFESDTTYGMQANMSFQQRNIVRWSKSGNIMDFECNGSNIKMSINPTAQNLPLLIGCDYQGTNNGTQRYFKGTIYKFKLYQTI